MNFPPPIQSSRSPDRLSLELLRSPADLRGLSHEWQSLWERSGQSPFQSPMWLIPWAECFTGDNLLVLALRFDSRLVAIAPFYTWTDEDRAKLFLLGNGLSDYLDFCIDPAYRHQIRNAFHHWLAKSPFQFCEFNQLPPSSILAEEPITPGDPCPVLDLRGKSSRDYAPPRQLEKLRYYRRRAAKTGQWRLESADSQTFRSAMAHLFRLHALRWTERGEPGVLNNRTIQAFHTRVAENLALSGFLRLYSLLLDRQTIGVLYAFANASSTYYYLSGFDPEFEKISPGTLLIGHAVEHAIEESHLHFNFLRGAEPYKYTWGAQNQPTFRRILTPSTVGRTGAPASPSGRLAR